MSVKAAKKLYGGEVDILFYFIEMRLMSISIRRWLDAVRQSLYSGRMKANTRKLKVSLNYQARNAFIGEEAKEESRGAV